MYDEKESLKKSYNQNKKKNKKKLKQLLDKGLDRKESIDSLRNKVTMLRMELNQNHENIHKAREVLPKAIRKDYCPKND